MESRPTGAALVTGASKRLGRAMAISLADAGYDIAVHFHASRTQAQEVVAIVEAKGRKAVALQANFSNEEETAALIPNCTKALGPLNLLVNSASVFENDDIASMSRESWDRHIETNLRAPLKLAQDFAAQRENGGGLIVNITDQRVLKLTPQFLSYTLSKAGLFTLTKILAQSLGPQGIRVNAIAPGPVLKNPRQSDADWQRQNEATILGHGATPDDVCSALIYLISAHSVTGQMVTVDGGQHLAWQTPDVLVKE